MYFLSSLLQIRQQNTGIIVIVVHSQPDPVDAVGELRHPCVGGGRKQVSAQIRIPERADGIDYQNIRIQIQNPVHLPGQQMGSQQPVVHFRRIPAAYGSSPEHLIGHLDGMKLVASGVTPAFQGLKHILRQLIVQQPDTEMLPGIIDFQRCQQHLQLREIILVQCK